MSSVRVSFTGRCREARARLRVVAYLRRLADRSEHYLAKPANGTPRVELVDRSLAGKIMVSDAIAPDARVFTDQARDAGLPLVTHPENRNRALAVLRDARLIGVNFAIFDSKDARRRQGRFSFVFLESSNAPFLDGVLVQTGAGTHLGRPEIELPVDLGDWIDLLFSWMKFFHIGDFVWHREEPLPNYAEYRAILLGLQNELGPERAEAAAFDALLATFANHAERGFATEAALTD